MAAMLLVVCVHGASASHEQAWEHASRLIFLIGLPAADQMVSRDRQLQVVPLLGSSVTTGQGILGHLQLWSTVSGGDNEAFVSVCDLPTNPTWNNTAAQVGPAAAAPQHFFRVLTAMSHLPEYAIR